MHFLGHFLPLTLPKMPTAEYLLWTDIQDIVGPASFWPRRIRCNFWIRSLSHWQRVLTATFVWINGLNPEVFYDWCELKGFFTRGSAIDITNSSLGTLEKEDDMHYGRGMF